MEGRTQKGGRAGEICMAEGEGRRFFFLTPLTWDVRFGHDRCVPYRQATFSESV